MNNLERISMDWSQALEKGDIDRALEIGIHGHIEARKMGDRQNRLMFLGFIRHASERLYSSLSDQTSKPPAHAVCSFCQREVSPLVRGVGVAICSDCVDEAMTSFRST